MTQHRRTKSWKLWTSTLAVGVWDRTISDWMDRRLLKTGQPGVKVSTERTTPEPDCSWSPRGLADWVSIWPLLIELSSSTQVGILLMMCRVFSESTGKIIELIYNLFLFLFCEFIKFVRFILQIRSEETLLHLPIPRSWNDGGENLQTTSN